MRPVRIPLHVEAPVVKRKVKKVKDRKPTLPTRLILPSKAPVLEHIPKPQIIVKPMAILPPPPPKRAPRVYLEPNYPITSPPKKRLPQQPSKYLMQSTVYHSMAEPEIRDHSPVPRVKPLQHSSTPIWTELFRRQAISKAEEVMVVPDSYHVPPRPVMRVRPHEPITIPQPAQQNADWIDVTDFEMPIRGARRRHLVLPADNTFEKQMRDFTLQLNAHKVKREDDRVRRQRVIAEDDHRMREESIDVERRHRMSRRHRSMPPIQQYDIRIKSKTPDYSPVRRERSRTPKITPIKPSKLDEWNIEVQKRAARTLAEPYVSNSSLTAAHRRKTHAPSRLWMPSDEYTHVTVKQHVTKKPPQHIKRTPVEPALPNLDVRSSPDIDDSRLRMLKDDIELNRRRRAGLRENREQEMMMMSKSVEGSLSSMRSTQYEAERGRRSDRMSMPPMPTIPQRRPFQSPTSPVRQISPSPISSRGSLPPSRRQPRPTRGVSLPPQQDNIRGKHVPHLPIQPSKFWLRSGEYSHITDDEFKHISDETEFRRRTTQDSNNLELKKLEQEFERDRQRREDKRRKHETRMESTRREDDNYHRNMLEERQQRLRMRQLSMPPMPRKDIIIADTIPKTADRPMPVPAYQDYVPKIRHSEARQQEIEIETITKRINENIESYEESLKRRNHYTIPHKKVISTHIHAKRKPKTNWSNLYTTVTERIEEKSDSEDEEWITLRRKRNKRHLVVPSAELSKSLTTESVPIRVSVNQRSASTGRDHSAFNVYINETDLNHSTRAPAHRHHVTEQAEFDSDWHAIAPHVREGKSVIKVRKAHDKHAPTYDKGTPAADSWMTTRYSKTVSESSDSDKVRSDDYSSAYSTRRHYGEQSYSPRRVQVNKSEPLSLRMLDQKAHHTRHVIEEREPEPVFRKRERRSRHNLVLPDWEPGASPARRSSRDSLQREPLAASSPVGRGRSYTPLSDYSFNATSASPVSLGRRASVSYMPRHTPSRDMSHISIVDRSTRAASIDRGNDIDVYSSGSSTSMRNLETSEHHVHPVLDTFKGAVDKVRERLPWRSLFKEAERRTHHKEACKLTLTVRFITFCVFLR